MKTAIYPGSFDPVTFGHLDIVRRAAKLFDHLIVLVSVNPVKAATFSAVRRKEFLLRTTIDIPNVEIDIFDGLLVDYMKEKSADIIVKGLRAMSDFEYEFQMALINRGMFEKAETVFLTADSKNTFLSSSVVKQIAMLKGDISAFVPKTIIDDINAFADAQPKAKPVSVSGDIFNCHV
ncbi:MAG: pantetheine-phosphate adenylyltransferase [Oscillospiraceae bacterium]|nr:pantetheine-phosphate adenylyltransferase [Oscillospiraceae bacterium]